MKTVNTSFDLVDFLLELGDRVKAKDDECVFSLFLEYPEFEQWYNNKYNERTEDTSSSNKGQS